MLQRRHHQVDNGEGWILSLRQVVDPEQLRRDLHPVLIVPGYGMNSSIFTYHGNGLSMEGVLAHAGFEVWAADLRNQGGSFATHGTRNYGMAHLAIADLGAIWRFAREHTFTGKSEFHGIGCSLGATLLYLGVAAGSAPLASLTSIAGPLRWVRVHPLIRILFSSPRLVGKIPIRGSRQFARLALPLLFRFPRLLSPYLNPELVDKSDVRAFVRTVEDPSRRINQEIAEWFCRRELLYGGRPLSEHLKGFCRPFFCIAANGDGIVPPESVFSAYHTVGSAIRKRLEVGTPQQRFAHADLFISRAAPVVVFQPLARWLSEIEEEFAKEASTATMSQAS